MNADNFCLIAKRGVAISGCSGFEDVQDVIGWFFVGAECCMTML
ncbi:hypothetical protein [Sphaerospermopsis sp. LEGE 08334]|nr:hypothetical protein [Sphaerospermopsis sp. LEGE 08334]